MTAGSCYAFAAAGALEAILAIDREANVTSELSEAELVDCLPSSDYGCDSNNECNGCNGGDPSTALEYALAQQGLPSAAAYPYGALISSDTAGTCLVSCTSFTKHRVVNRFYQHAFKEVTFTRIMHSRSCCHVVLLSWL